MYHGTYRPPLTRTLFERLQHVVPRCMLLTQYRMHPHISSFPSRAFYGAQLQDDPNVTAERTASRQKLHDLLPPYQFVDVVGGVQERDGTSLYNRAEAAYIVATLERLIQSLDSLGTVGIITPYLAQQRILEQELGSRFPSVFVSTVDAFQGRERDLIFLSCVRTGGPDKSVGFVADSNRLNVSITRAKYCCCIVGNAKTLGSEPVWRSLLQDATARNVIVQH